MLALFRARPQLHSPLYTRTLRTRPRIIPSHIRTWDPTRLRSPDYYDELPLEKRERLDESQHDALQQVVVKGAEGNLLSLAVTAVGTKPAAERLDHLLQRCSLEGGNEHLRAPLWRAYVLAKAADTRLLHRLPDRAWDLLQSTQSVQVPENRHRSARLAQLNHDMHVAHKLISAVETTHNLDTLFTAGESEEALQEWRVHYSTEPEYLELGVKIHVLAGHLDQAETIMDELYESHPTWNSSAMMTVFRAYTSAPLYHQREHARKIYKKLRSHRGEHATIQDYDTWLVGFLEARSLKAAMQVFRNMVTDGHVDVSESSEAIEVILERLHMLYRLGDNISSMTSIVLNGISVLPSAYHSHLFGDWLKAAVVYKAPEAAAQILDLMVQKNLRPLTFHFNMLLRALLRSKKSPSILKAENIAWRMVAEARKAGPHVSPLLKSTAEFIRANVTNISPLSQQVKGTPIADVDTFALIMQHHARSLQWEHVDYLNRQLKSMPFKPNATIMNVLMDNKIRQGAYVEAWSIYKSHTEPETASGDLGVYPDGASLRAAWKNLRFALGDPATRHHPSLPSPRELLKETLAWGALHRSRFDASRFRQGLASADSGAITALIMHCFSYTQDLPGSLVALHALRHKFDIFPTPGAKSILVRQMAWVDLSTESKSVSSQYYHSQSNAKNTARIMKAYDLLSQARLTRLDAEGHRKKNSTAEQVGDHGLNLLSEFVRAMLKRTYPPEEVERMISEVKCFIDLPGLKTGDIDAWQVP